MGTTFTPPARTHHPHRILVCLDRSSVSEGCVPDAIALATTFESAVTLVHVMQPQQDPARPQTCDALGWEISRQEALCYLERLEREVSSALGRPVDVRLEQGRAAERIVDLARETGAALIVLGRGGEGASPGCSLGSTAQRVLALARSSVFITPTPHSSATIATRRVLVPLDGSLRAESVLPAATRISRAEGAELLLLHVVEDPVQTELLTTTEDINLARVLAGRLESSAARYLNRLQRQLESADEKAAVHTLVVRHANECQCLLSIAEREKGTLLVLSAHGAACDSAEPVGSVAAYLLSHASTPLLVLQDVPAYERRGFQDGDAFAPPLLQTSYADNP
jgi:nucleotide-binding universal stress UspA family protein